MMLSVFFYRHYVSCFVIQNKEHFTVYLVFIYFIYIISKCQKLSPKFCRLNITLSWNFSEHKSYFVINLSEMSRYITQNNIHSEEFNDLVLFMQLLTLSNNISSVTTGLHTVSSIFIGQFIKCHIYRSFWLLPCDCIISAQPALEVVENHFNGIEIW